MDSKETLYILLRESLPGAEPSLIDSLFNDISKKTSMLNLSGSRARIYVERMIRLSEFRSLGLIDD